MEVKKMNNEKDIEMNIEEITFEDLKEMEEVVSGSSVGPIFCCNA